MVWRVKRERGSCLSKEWMGEKGMKFRLNNEMRGARYWKAEEKGRCRMYGGGEEIWEHVLFRESVWVERKEKTGGKE